MKTEPFAKHLIGDLDQDKIKFNLKEALNKKETIDTEWLESEEAKTLLLMIEEDIFKSGNYWQRNFDTDLNIEINTIPVILLWVAIYGTWTILSLLFLGSGVLFFFLFAGFFASIFAMMGLCSNPYTNFLFYRKPIIKAVKKLGSTENFISFMAALKIAHAKQNNKKLSSSEINNIKEELKSIYPAVDSIYSGHTMLPGNGAKVLGEEFRDLFVRVRDVSNGSYRAKKVDKIVEFNGENAKEAMLEYLKKD